MKINELIEKLEAIRAEHGGDITVMRRAEDGGYRRIEDKDLLVTKLVYGTDQLNKRAIEAAPKGIEL